MHGHTNIRFIPTSLPPTKHRPSHAFLGYEPHSVVREVAAHWRRTGFAICLVTYVNMSTPALFPAHFLTFVIMLSSSYTDCLYITPIPLTATKSYLQGGNCNDKLFVWEPLRREQNVDDRPVCHPSSHRPRAKNIFDN